MKTFDTVAKLKLAKLKEGQFVETGGYSAKGDGGAARYLIVTPQSFDGYGDHELANGNVAVLQETKARSKRHGLVGDGVADDTLAIQAFRDFLSANPSVELVFDEGRYKYTTSPNWAIDKTIVTFEGDVTFYKVGAGTALIFDSGTSGLTFDFRFGWGNRVNVEGDESSYGGVYVRSCHHCKIGANVRGCGATFDAFRVEFSVLGEYDFVASTNQVNTFSTQPLRGLYVGRRGTGGDATSACIFYNLIIEGVSGDGVVVDYGIKNLFLGGTTEGNGNTNLICTANSDTNTFQGIDLEVAGSGTGLSDAGAGNTFNDVLNDAQTTIEATAVNSSVVGGVYDAIVNYGKGSSFTDFSYSSQGGAFTDSGTMTTVRDAYYLLGARYFPNNKTQGRNDFITTESFPYTWGTPAGVPGFSKRTALPVTGVKAGDIVTATSLTTAAAGFIPTPSCECTTDGQIEITYTQLTGAAASPLSSGSDFVISVRGTD
jgi:hypothetical protein